MRAVRWILLLLYVALVGGLVALGRAHNHQREVRLRQGGEGLNSGNTLAFSLPWTANSGRHTLVLKAYDLAGNFSESELITFTVQRK